MAQIRTFQDLWDATIQAFQAGDYDTDAMSDIYRRMDPKLGFDDLAAVFSGVYADTYWATTKMDPSIMAKSMVQAIGLDYNLALNYAQAAMKTWRGTLVRKNVSDVGNIPCTYDYSQSIDIVCNSDTPINTDTLITNWNNQFWKQPVVGKNYVYTRVQNRWFQGDLTPGVQMFYTDGGFNQPPSSWLQLLTAANGDTAGVVNTLGGKPEPMANGERGASEGFIFDPKSTDHVCIIAAITTEYFAKNNPLTINGNWNSTEWITYNGAAGWHNVNPQQNAVEKFAFYNQDGSTEKFAFEAVLQNVPAGYTVGLSADRDDAKFGKIKHKVASGVSNFRTECILPPNYKGTLKVEISGPKGELLPENASVKIRMLWLLGNDHKHYGDVSNLRGVSDKVRSGAPLEQFMGSFTLTGK